ncbi:hypothetical protein ACQP3D_29235, partial [Escherichia coli]
RIPGFHHHCLAIGDTGESSTEEEGSRIRKYRWGGVSASFVSLLSQVRDAVKVCPEVQNLLTTVPACSILRQIPKSPVLIGGR